ncbi:hypothetical protein F5Y17DRAFT_437137 [Xylariaceae sp. FL0594]|nr:hypothetical protein F5Y17DRAFT_437137 [Xylariaceae sp. FL0594]
MLIATLSHFFLTLHSSSLLNFFKVEVSGPYEPSGCLGSQHCHGTHHQPPRAYLDPFVQWPETKPRSSLEPFTTEPQCNAHSLCLTTPQLGPSDTEKPGIVTPNPHALAFHLYQEDGSKQPSFENRVFGSDVTSRLLGNVHSTLLAPCYAR